VKNYQIQLYKPSDATAWNTFIASAKNATFLFHRDFMDYHSDRFTDHSLLIYEQHKLVAVLPANKINNSVFSHQGLTYGGLIYTPKTKLSEIITIFRELLFFLHQNQVTTLQIKMIPSVYHKKPSQELEYALFLTQAKLLKRDSMAVIDLSSAAEISKTRLSEVKKGAKNQLEIREEQDCASFWNTILVPELAKKHHAKPVHSLSEISLLKSRFPNNIRQFNVYHNNTIIAGTTIFETDTTAHAQYISGNEYKSQLGSLDFLYEHLLTQVFQHKKFFDFGISNENHGKILNSGLSFWKESFGAGTIVHDCYEVETANYTQLNTVFK